MPRKKIKDDRTHLISEDQDAGETSYGSLHHDFVEISEVGKQELPCKDLSTERKGLACFLLQPPATQGIEE